ncbi:MAG: hypothetical protein LBN25_01000 [Christensenellaceae bacterium]|jgi:hypothetical protein|nr:hypothetical protein [Christensenellaceae bacterium]
MDMQRLNAIEEILEKGTSGAKMLNEITLLAADIESLCEHKYKNSELLQKERMLLDRLQEKYRYLRYYELECGTLFL